VGRVPDQPYGLVAALGQEALEQERDLPVPAGDHYSHSATLLTGLTGRAMTSSAGRCPARAPRRPRS